MCGLAGVLNHPQGEKVLESLLTAQIHRGPDSQGTHTESGVALGMRRLAILDQAGGDQPRFDVQKNVMVFFNGEIYNHRELRAQFSQFKYTSQTDTEVIPHLWAQRSAQTLHLLRGMFALAVWEPKKRQLTLARDRLGIKPLWIYEHQGVIAFSSELQAFAQAGLSLSLDTEALWDYLTHSYIPAPRSPFKEVRLLKPGHFCVYQEVEGSWQKDSQRWWQLPREQVAIEPEEAVAKVRELIESSVQEHLVSDVPLGCLLSGGLDSAVLTAWASRLKGEPLHTFSVGYQDTDFDEREPAAQLARELKCPHHSVELSSLEFLKTLDVAVKRGDTLLADQALVALVPLYDCVREHVTVVLDGDGADEVFAGYPTVQADRYFQTLSRLPLSFRRALADLSGWLPESGGKASFIFKLERFLRHADLDLAQAHALWRNIHPLSSRQRLVDPQWYPKRSRDFLGLYHWLEAIGNWSEDPQGALTRGDLSIWLPDDNLKKVDGQSMGVSVEARVPFLDHRLVETVLPWSIDLKRQFGVKGLMREASRGVLPEFALKRPKAGFHLPLKKWFAGPLKNEVKSRLFDLNQRIEGFFQKKQLHEDIEKGRLDSYSVFNLLVLESWLRQWPGPAKI